MSIDKHLQELEEIIQRLKNSAESLKESNFELHKAKLKLASSVERLEHAGLLLKAALKAKNNLDNRLN